MLEIDLGGFKGVKHPLNTMIKGLSNKEYHEAGGLSSTRFELIRKSVRVFKFRHLFDTWKPCFDEGTLCHDCILTPENIDKTYIESPTLGLDTKKAEALREANPDKIIVAKGMIEHYLEISKIVNEIVPFLKYADKEVSFFHYHKDADLLMQARPDIYIRKFGMLYDLKSTKANSQEEFEKIIEPYNYDLSLAYYNDVLNLCGYKTNLELMGWLCIPKSAPHIPFMVRVSEELLEKGRSKYQELLARYMDYIAAEKELGEEDMNLIISDLARYKAHSYEYRKENYINVA
ncbi:PD-(D/E)XK nuclease-like domain-containing protein [Campylobacter sp. FOBRC14]|uniref:PD-(D/E)XK nuclease-like domain-containing protein n=1 Tax=Campylobacter sp. FOBRC14 TaxID=936554 RepID=UPI00027A3853|nr:PD-(D/E)XK nuclease-like domain-containing protein [Campylobacter sp. FOBRC14]EJP74684.1 hypothetical protein HMPREF1139_2307 [Campylobacter sp. FOBRC14]